jgi:hypothetical protein
MAAIATAERFRFLRIAWHDGMVRRRRESAERDSFLGLLHVLATGDGRPSR